MIFYINISIDQYLIFFQLPEGNILKCRIYDSKSQGLYRDVVHHYLQRVNCCIIVYDITDLNTFIECENYYKNIIIEKCKKDVKVMLIGNKKDLENKRKVTKEQGLKFAKENNYLFRETSCFNLDSIIEEFETIIMETFKIMKK